MSSGWKQASSDRDKKEIGEVRGCVFTWGVVDIITRRPHALKLLCVCVFVSVFHKGDKTSSLVQTGEQLVIRKDFNSFLQIMTCSYERTTGHTHTHTHTHTVAAA